MTKYKIESFNDLEKIIKVQLIKHKMMNNISINYENFCNIMEGKNIVEIFQLMKKLNMELFAEE